MIGLLAMLLLIAGTLGWVQLAPSDPARWHQAPDPSRATSTLNSALREIAMGEDTMKKLDAIIRRTSRTRVLAGSVDTGMITYVTRSAPLGFPDYTTVHQRDDSIEIYGRARFGISDFGVNAARIDGWLEALTQEG